MEEIDYIYIRMINEEELVMRIWVENLNNIFNITEGSFR